MAKYRKLPVVVEAIQFLDNVEALTEISEFAGDKVVVSYDDPNVPVLKIETLEGTMKANVGDWIIKGIRGEFYPCKHDIFNKTYEEVEE